MKMLTKAWLISWCLLTAVMFLTFHVLPVLASTLFDYNDTENALWEVTSAKWTGQTFTPSSTYSVDAIGIKGAYNAGPANSVKVEIYLGKPNSGSLQETSGWVTVGHWSSVPTDTWYNVSMAGTTVLSSGTEYSIVLKGNSPMASMFNASWQTANVFATGDFWGYNSGWTEHTGWDQAFRMYGTEILPEPVAIEDFTATRTGPGTVFLSWTNPSPNDEAQVWASKDGYPWQTGTGWVIYDGSATAVNATVPEILDYYFSGWGKLSGNLSSSAADAFVQGETMNATLSFEPSLIVLVVAMFLLFISIFINKMLMMVVLFVAWFMVIPTINNAWVDGTAGIIMIYAVLNFLKLRKGGDLV